MYKPEEGGCLTKELSRNTPFHVHRCAALYPHAECGRIKFNSEKEPRQGRKQLRAFQAWLQSVDKMADNTQLPGYVHFFAGAAGGAFGTILTSPLEVVKTRLQSSQAGQFAVAQNAAWYARSKTWLCLSESIRKEGVRVLWRGLGPNLVGVVPSRSIYFFTYSFSKRHLTQLTSNKKENPLIHIASAVSAGLATTSATNPLWLIKTRLQLMRSGHGEGVSTLSVISHIFRTEGITGFYRGLSASYVGIVFFYFVLSIGCVMCLKQEYRKQRCSF